MNGRALMMLIAGLLLALSTGCAQTKSNEAESSEEKGTENEGEPAAEEESAEATDEAPESLELVVKDVSIDGADVSLHDESGKMKVCLDCGVRSATYNYCMFEKGTFEEALGSDYASKKVIAKVEMVQVDAENYVPADPNAPQPDGGFTHVYHDCTITEVSATKP